jgi:esterase/lipase
VTTDLGGAPANVWWLLGIVVTGLGGLATTWVLSRRPGRPAPTTTAPVAAQTAREAVEEYKQLFMAPMREENEQLRARIDDLERQVALAERAQAQAERDAAAVNAELTGLRPALTKALRDLADERRRPDAR